MATATIQQIEAEQIAKFNESKKIPEFRAGDTLKVGVKVVEGERTRVQNYEGVCIARQGAGLQELASRDRAHRLSSDGRRRRRPPHLRARHRGSPHPTATTTPRPGCRAAPRGSPHSPDRRASEPPRARRHRSPR